RIADELMTLAWWDWDHERLRTALPDFRNLPVEAFVEKYRDNACADLVLKAVGT
ncbi:MAG: chloramphenicol acetyltransferase, partial [Candidatus Afipia apatlaquensis]|nr:chloramphenicol acetyltransferase [Candidatus Afipia apatlaquensis]